MTHHASADTVRPVKGEEYIAYADRRPAERVFIRVTRVARDGSWADIVCMTWAVLWRKRQPLKDGTIPYAVCRPFYLCDLEEQEEDHMAKLREKGVLSDG